MSADVWTFEPGDPSVGIFGDVWYHECDWYLRHPDADGATETVVRRTVTDPVVGAVEIVTELRCPCGSTKQIFDYDYDPPEEAFQ